MDTQPLKVQVDSKQAQADLAALAMALDRVGNASQKFGQNFETGMAGVDKAASASIESVTKFAAVATKISQLKLSGDSSQQIKQFAQSLNSLAAANAALRGDFSGITKAVEVTGLLSKIRLDSGATKSIRDFGDAMMTIGRIKAPSSQALKGMVDFIEVAQRVQGLKFSDNTAAALKNFASAMEYAGKAKAPSDSKLKNFVNFIEVAARAQNLKFDGGAAQGLRGFAAALNAVGDAKGVSTTKIANMKALFELLPTLKAPNIEGRLESFFKVLTELRVPSEKSIARLKTLFTTLSEAKEVPGAAKIARDLDTITAAANRASKALNDMPSSTRGLSSTFAKTGEGAAKLNNEIKNTPGHASKAKGAFGDLEHGLGDLGHRFDLTYQASTLFSQFFSAFTVGEFLRSIYDTGIEMAKLQKGLVFATGSFKEAADGIHDYIAISDHLGTNAEKNGEAFSKFAVAAKATGVDFTATKKIYTDFETALQVTGASTEQATLAFYGLQQMMSKGKVVSEEFNRQIGEQIPGNAAAGTAAYNRMIQQTSNSTDKATKSTADFFKAMSLGQLDASKFIPLYTEELGKMFSPLLTQAQARPDSALNQLSNAFLIFKKEISDQGFMSSLTGQFHRLHDAIVDTNGNLTPAAKKLADTLGQNLVTLVHGAGDVMAFLATHIDQVVTAIKLMLALKVADTFMDWTKGAMAFAGSLTKITSNLNNGFGKVASMFGGGKAKTVEKVASEVAPAAADAAKEVTKKAAIRDAEKAAAQAMLPEVGATSAIIAQRELGGYKTVTNEIPKPKLWDRAKNYLFPPITTDVRASSRLNLENDVPTPKAWGSMKSAQGAEAAARDTFGLRGVAQDVEAVDTAATKAGSSSGGLSSFLGNLFKFKGAGAAVAEGAEATAATVGKSVGIVGMLGGAVEGLIPLLATGFVGAIAGAGVALAVFGDNTTKIGEKTVKFNDIVAGGIKVLGDSFKDFGKGTQFKALNEFFDFLSKNGGDIVLHITAAFVTFGKVIGDLFGGFADIVKIDFIDPLEEVLRLITLLSKGDWMGAAKEYGKWVGTQFTDKGMFAQTKQAVVNTAGAVVGTALGASNDVAAVSKAAGDIATDRDNKTAADAATEAQHAQAEAAIQAMQKEAQDQRDAADLAAIQRTYSLKDANKTDLAGLVQHAADQKTAFSATPQLTPDQIADQSMGPSAIDIQAKIIAGIDAARKKFGDVSVNNSINAIQNAASANRVDPALMEAIALRESSFNPNARPVDKNGKLLSSAQGLFQITDGTAKGLGVSGNLMDATTNANAAAKLINQNADFLKGRLGRDASAGEIYAAHFMGAGGAYSLIKSAQEDPTGIAADRYKAEAKANPWVFYENAGKPGQRALTNAELIKNLEATAGGRTGVAGQGVAGISADQLKTDISQYRGAQQTYDEVIGKSAPEDAAQGRFDSFIDKIKKLEATSDDLQKRGLPPIIDPVALQKAIDQQQKILEEGINPFLKLSRAADDANKVSELRAKGLNTEADFQEKLNGFKEAGYDITKLDTQANRDALKVAKDRNDLLQSEIDLRSQLNQVSISRIARTGSPLDAEVARRLKPLPGQSLEDARAQADRNGSLGNIVKGAQADLSEKRAGAVQNISNDLGEQAIEAGLTSDQKQFRDDYKSYLQQISGITDQSVANMEKMDSGAAALAKQAATIKQQLENPPGFEKWVNGLEPLAKRLEDIKVDFANSLSDGITDSLMGDKVDWAGMAKKIQRELVKAQVDEALGGVMKALGIAKPKTEQEKAADALLSVADNQANVTLQWSTVADKWDKIADKFAQGQGGGSAASAATTGYGSSSVGGSGLPTSGLGGTPLSADGITPALTPSDISTNSGIPDITPFDPSSVSLPSLDSVSSPSGMGSVFDSDPDPITTITANPANAITPYPSIGDISTDAGIPAITPFDPSSVTLPSLAPQEGMLGKVGDMLGVTSGGKMNGLGGSLLATGAIGLLGQLFKKKKHPFIDHPINGVIGSAGAVNMSGTQVAAHANLVGSILSSVVGMAGGKGFGVGGGNLTSALMAPGGFGNVMGQAGAGLSGLGSSIGSGLGSIGSFFASMFKEGGITTEAVSKGSMAGFDWSKAPHYAEGTANTNGGMPAIVHPNEAVVPLSRGRSIPVELPDGAMSGGGTTHYNTNITVVTPNADSFRKSSSSIQREQSMANRKANARNLNGG